MSGSATVAEWGATTARFATSWPIQVANAAAERIRRQVEGDTGGDARLSNHEGGAALVEVIPGEGAATVKATGAFEVWGILEHGTKPHRIRARYRSALLTPYGPKGMVQVAGMRARQTWSKGVAAAQGDAMREANRAFEEAYH